MVIGFNEVITAFRNNLGYEFVELIVLLRVGFIELGLVSNDTSQSDMNRLMDSYVANGN